MSLFAGSRHPGDDDLIRYLDHQLDRDGMRTMGAHLRTCAECEERLEGWRKRSALVGGWLERIPGQVPDANRRAVALAAIDRARFRSSATGPIGLGWMKAAAVFILLFAGGLATETGRAFVAQGIVKVAGREPGSVATRMVEWLGQERQLHEQRLATAPAPMPVPAAALPVPQPVAAAARPATERHAAPRIKPGMSATVRFTPAGPDVALVFASRQDAGSATVWIREAAAAGVQAVDGYHGEELVPTADGLEVHNRQGSHADYMITVPARYRFIRVKVGDTPEVMIRISKAKQEWIWTINLQNSALQ